MAGPKWTRQASALTFECIGEIMSVLQLWGEGTVKVKEIRISEGYHIRRLGAQLCVSKSSVHLTDKELKFLTGL